MESSQVVQEDSPRSCKLDFTSTNTTAVSAARDYTNPDGSDPKLEVGLAPKCAPKASQRAPEKLHPLAPKPVERHPEEIFEEERAANSVSKNESQSNRRSDVCQMGATTVKEESGLSFKECILCAGRTDDTFDVFSEMTCCGQVTLCSYICKVANLTLDQRLCVTKYTCRSCFELLNLVEQAEIEFLKHRDLLLDIIGQNPTLARFDELDAGGLAAEYVKVEHCKSEHGASSEDDEPLAFMKPSRRTRTENYTPREPSPIDCRHFSSDEDFYWKLETKDEQNFGQASNFNTFTFKKSRSGRPKGPKIKEEVDQKDPSEMLIVELQEATREKSWRVPSKRKKENVKPKHKHKRHEKKKRDGKKLHIDKIDLTCMKCNKTFTKKSYYDYHMARHDNLHLPFICEVCGKGFKNRKMCDVHVLMHQGIADFKCIPCNKLFPTKFAFLRHDKIHKGKPKYQCDLCGKSFIHQSSFRMHKLAHAGIKKHACDICGLALLSTSHLSRHKRIHSGEKRYECDCCGKKFSEKYNMQSHMRTHMKGKERPPSPANTPGRRKRWFRCEMCEEKFDRLFKLEIHLVDDHKVVLKKGRPKPRNTMKKLQRAQQAAASVVNAIATAMGAKRAADQLLASGSTEPNAVDVKPSVSTLNEKIKETSSSAPVFKTSPQHHSMSPAATYMSPPPADTGAATAESMRAEYQEHQQQVIRSASAVWPHMAYNMGVGYLSRMPDYSQH